MPQRNPKIQLKSTFATNNNFFFLSANGFGQYVQAFADGGWDDVEDVLDQWPRVVPPFPSVVSSSLMERHPFQLFLANPPLTVLAQLRFWWDFGIAPDPPRAPSSAVAHSNIWWTTPRTGRTSTRSFAPSARTSRRYTPST